MTQPDLTGIWVTGGGWSTYAVILRPDGTGRLEFSNLHTTHSLAFGWRAAAGLLEVTGSEQTALNDAQDGVVTEPWDSVASIPYTVGVLRPDGAAGHAELRLSRPILDWFPLVYLSGNPAFDLFSPPDFSWLRQPGGT